MLSGYFGRGIAVLISVKSALLRAGLGLTIVLAAASSLRAQDTVRLGHNRTWSNTALILALANGNFSEVRVKVVEHEFTTPADIVTGIASGDLDAGAVPPGNFFAAVTRGVKIKAVAVLQGRNNPPIAFTMRTDSGIKSADDLRGKTAGVNNYGGTHDIYLRQWLTGAGLDPKKDVNIITLPVPAMVPTLINRQIDIVPMASFDQVILDQRYPGQTKPLFSYDDVLLPALGGRDNNGILLVMAEDFLAKNRDTSIRFLQAYVRAIRNANADPKRAVREWAGAVGNDMLKNLAAPPALPNDGKIVLAALQFDADLTHRFGYLQSPIDVRSMIDNSIVDAAIASLR
jgi:ABC-type nitrate/sulfonate/bicarbonate transport system substrate-binding protein